MNHQEILDLFVKVGVMKKGHFKLTSGRHADTYMQCASLFTDTEASGQICAELAKKLAHLDADMVISPAVGGVLMGYEIARQLKKPNIFAERENGEMRLRRGFGFKPGAKFIVVEDVVTTGGSVKEVVSLVKSLGGEVCAVAAIVDRSNGAAGFGVPFIPLISMNIQSWAAEDCPLCRDPAAGPAYKPGSRN